jgi:hypothetical protein
MFPVFMSPMLFAWSWEGHGQLTCAALAFAIARLVPMGKTYVMKRLNEFAALRTAIETATFGSAGYRPTEEQVTRVLQRVEGQAPNFMQQNLIRLFDDIPSAVQEEDLHIGNIPNIGKVPIVGKPIAKDAQIRHFMRSTEETSVREAYIKSKEYIWDHLFYAWYYMKKGVFHKPKWYDFINDSSLSDFDKGSSHLAKALHTIEDSYAPGHVQRRSGSGVIEDVHIWDEKNKKKDLAHGWPGHEALDNPTTLQSRPFFEMGRVATGSLIYCVLASLDQTEATYVKTCGTEFNKDFIATFI